LAMTLSYVEKQDESIDHIKRAIRLNPFPPYWYYFVLAQCYRQKGQYEKAISEYTKALQINPDAYVTHVGLTITYMFLDRQEDARAAAKKVLELNPYFSLEKASKGWPYKNHDRLKAMIDALSKAGLPFKPPVKVK